MVFQNVSRSTLNVAGFVGQQQRAYTLAPGGSLNFEFESLTSETYALIKAGDLSATGVPVDPRRRPPISWQQLTEVPRNFPPVPHRHTLRDIEGLREVMETPGLVLGYGPQGPAGEKGDKGDDGDVGDTGAQGEKGDTGDITPELEQLREDTEAFSQAAADSATTALNAIAGQYKGGVAGNAVPATSTLAGDTYRITSVGTSQSKTWAIGDAAIYNGVSGSWTQLTGFYPQDGEHISLGTLSTAGNTDVSASSSVKRRVFAEAIIGGSSAFTRTITLTSTHAQAGDERVLLLTTPPPPANAANTPIVEVRNLTSSGDILLRVDASRSGPESRSVALRFDGTNWRLVDSPERPDAVGLVGQAIRASRELRLDFVGGASSVYASATISAAANAVSGWQVATSITTAHSAAAWVTSAYYISGFPGDRQHKGFLRRHWAWAAVVGPQIWATTGGALPDARLRLTLGKRPDILGAATGSSVGLPSSTDAAIGFEMRPTASGGAWWGWTYDGSAITYYDLGYLQTDRGGGDGQPWLEVAIAGTPAGEVEFWVAGAARLLVSAPGLVSANGQYFALQMSATTGATADGVVGSFGISLARSTLVIQ